MSNSAWKVPYIDLGAQYQALKPQLDEAIGKVMASGRYINGEETERFEEAMARYLGVKHVIGVGNGYDALYLALRAFGGLNGDLVVVDKYTHISTHAAIETVGAEVVFGYENVRKNTPLYIPVHMNGRASDNAGCPVPMIEDACQAIGAKVYTRLAGTIGKMGCFSFHPMKVLSCAGDGGAICTDSSTLNLRLRDMRNHGNGIGYGVNSRLDNLQAAILNVKLPFLDSFIQRRREIAQRYEDELPQWVEKPPAPSDGPYFDTYSSYVIGGSPELLAHMRGMGIECFSHIRKDVVSLPIYPEMKDGHIAMVCAAVKAYENTSHRL